MCGETQIFTASQSESRELSDEELKERKRFIGKVFLILVAMIIVTLLQIIPVLIMQKARDFLSNYYPVISAPIAIYLVSMIACSSLPVLRRKQPYNIIMLIIVMESVTFLIMFLTAKYGVVDILAGFGIATGLCTILGIISFFCKTDFGTTLLVVQVMGLITFAYVTVGVLVYVFYPSRVLMIFILSFMVFILSLYFFFQIQQLLYGRYQGITTGDYVFAALLLYTDFMSFVLLFATLFRSIFERRRP